MNKIHTFVRDGFRYTKDHPQFLFTLLLIIIIPFAFFVSGQQFLNASRDNQATLENGRIGLMQDVFLSLIVASNAHIPVIQKEIDRTVRLNPDIVDFRVVRKSLEGFTTVVALDQDLIGLVDSDSLVYDLAFTNPDQSFVQSIEVESKRYIRGVRLVEFDSNVFIIYTVISRESIDEVFAGRTVTAYYWLFAILAIVLLLVFRHVRLIDYGYLYKETKRVNEMKDLFTNMIAHELRAPLTAIRGYASMIDESDNVPAEEKKYANRIVSSSERLIAIVSDLLDVARIESGKLKVELQSDNVSSVVVAVCEELQSSALEHKISLVHSGTDVEHTALFDQKRLHQAFTNVVSNAIKYTKEGSIELSLEDKNDAVEVRIKDTGMGISASDQKQLFAPFFRVENDDVSQITGTGLGMWITRQLVELMGAKIGVESIKGVGTHIVVTIPQTSRKNT
jgi:signal transduction histidine kinase